MKKYLVLFSALMLLFGLSGIANAVYITYDYSTLGNEFISPYANQTGFYTKDFESPNDLLGDMYLPNGVVVSGSAPGLYSAPMGVNGNDKDASQYLTVPKTDSGDKSATLFTPPGLFNYLGLWWGSVDSYNKLEFFNGADLVATVNGSDVYNPADGNQTAYNTNKYVNIFLGQGDFFDSIKLTSNQYAFEVDNLTVGVPEPATMLLLGFGLFGLAGISRKLKK